MDIIFICRHAEENSVLTNIAMAMDAVQSGQSAAVLFTEDALAALAGRSLEWAPTFKERGARILVSRRATALGYPMASEKDSRWTDMKRLLGAAKEAGVALWACPLWTQLLGVGKQTSAEGEGGLAARPGEQTFSVTQLPSGVTPLGKGQALQELQTAKNVIRGF